MKNYDLEHDWLDFVALQEKKQSNFFVIDDQTKEKIYHKNKKYFDSLLKYLKKELDITKSVKIILEEDEENSKKVLGRTGGYINQNWKIHIFVTGRHVKDILRSLSHEMVHHQQNIRGEFNGDQPTEKGYAQKNPHLRKMEKEAYLKGNMLFRDWEDNYKYKNKEERAKEVVKELKNILNNSKLLKEYEPDSAAMDRYVQTQSKYVAEKAKQAEAEEERFKEYCRNAGINDKKCYKKGTYKYYSADCVAKYGNNIRAIQLTDESWRCLWIEPKYQGLKCKEGQEPFVNNQIGAWECKLKCEEGYAAIKNEQGKFECRPNYKYGNFKVYYNLTANSNEYSNAVKLIKLWAQENEFFVPEESEESEEYQFDQKDIKYYIPEEVLSQKENFMEMEPEFLQAARIITNDTNFKNYGYMLCDGTNLWRVRKTKDDPENYHPIDSPYCQNGKQYYRIARQMVGMNTSSRQIIQAQEVKFGSAPQWHDPSILTQWVDSKLSWWSYLGDDWKRIVELYRQKRYAECAILFLDTFSIFDPSGASDILQGIILIANGDVKNGLICIAIGSVSAGMFTADLMSAGVLTPAYLTVKTAGKEAVNKKVAEFLGKIAYHSEGRILVLKSAESASARRAARDLLVMSRRAARALETNQLKNRSEKEVLEEVLGGPLKPWSSPVRSSDIQTFKSVYAQQMAVTKNPAMAAAQTGLVGMTVSQQAEKSAEIQRKEEENKKILDTFKQTCKIEGYEDCKYFELGENDTPVIKKQYQNSPNKKEIQSLGTLFLNDFSKNLKKVNIRRTFYPFMK